MHPARSYGASTYGASMFLSHLYLACRDFTSSRRRPPAKRAQLHRVCLAAVFLALRYHQTRRRVGKRRTRHARLLVGEQKTRAIPWRRPHAVAEAAVAKRAARKMGQRRSARRRRRIDLAHETTARRTPERPRVSVCMGVCVCVGVCGCWRRTTAPQCGRHFTRATPKILVFRRVLVLRILKVLRLLQRSAWLVGAQKISGVSRVG